LFLQLLSKGSESKIRLELTVSLVILFILIDNLRSNIASLQ